MLGKSSSKPLLAFLIELVIFGTITFDGIVLFCRTHLFSHQMGVDIALKADFFSFYIISFSKIILAHWNQLGESPSCNDSTLCS